MKKFGTFVSIAMAATLGLGLSGGRVESQTAAAACSPLRWYFTAKEYSVNRRPRPPITQYGPFISKSVCDDRQQSTADGAQIVARCWAG